MRPPIPAQPELLGSRYAIERELGRGGAAVVYVARDQHLDREVAVKVLGEDFANAIGHSRFLREIRIASQLRHPHIVPVLDYGESDGALWYVMPLLQDGSLRQLLDREPQLKVEHAVRLGAEVAGALAYAHGQGFVHRDVKPENLLLDGEHVLLADFGIARGMEVIDRITSTGIAVGTPAYMSPEQATGADALDGRSDVYSLACVLYECLAGVAPFNGPTSQSVIAQRFAHAPHPLSSYRSTVPAPVLDVIERGLNLTPADRPDARALCDVLRGGPKLTRGTAASEALSKPSRAALMRRVALLVIPALALVAIIAAASRWSTPVPTLDAGKVVLVPLTATGDGELAAMAQRVPSVIGVALDNVPALRWIEAENIGVAEDGAIRGGVHGRRIRAVRGSGSRYMIDGTVVQANDSVHVIMRLVDATDDIVVARGAASALGGAGQTSTLALRAVGQLLPKLIGSGTYVDQAALAQRDPRAIAALLLGDGEFRHSRYVEALAHYEAALAVDSNLAIAALKAARSARSIFEEASARKFVALALARDSLLSGASKPFARGLSYFYRHRGDSAIAQLSDAKRLAPESAEIHSAIGDVHFYVGVDGVDADSASESSYRRSIERDSSYTPALYHLLLLSARRHDPTGTRSLLAQYQKAQTPNSGIVLASQAIAECQSKGADSVKWKRVAETSATALLDVAKAIAGTGADLACSRAAFQAIFEKPGQPSVEQWGGMIGLNAIYMATSDTVALRALSASSMAIALRIRNFLLVDAVADPGMVDPADIAATMLSDLKALNVAELWYLGVYFGSRGQTSQLQRMIAEMRAVNARADGRPDAPRADDELQSLEARALLLRGDTAAARTRLARVHENASFQDAEWRDFESRAADNLLLAEIALRHSEPRTAIHFSERLNHANPIVNLVFFRPALSIRLRAAQMARDAPRALQVQRQMAALRRP